MRIAYQGEPGAYSEAAALKLYGQEHPDLLPCKAFDDVFQAVGSGKASHGILPIENSSAGTIRQNFDLLLKHSLFIVGEVELLVEHCLLANSGASLDGLRRVYSHYQGLAQCEDFLRSMQERQPLEIVPTYDTAGSAKLIRDRALVDEAAIASKRAGEIFGLDVLASNIQDYRNNMTHFVVVARDAVSGDTDKTTLIFGLRSVPGALFKALSIFSTFDINLTKLESLSVRGAPGEHMFYVDMDIGRDERCQRAILHLSYFAKWMKQLGSYKGWKSPAGESSGGAAT